MKNLKISLSYFYNNSKEGYKLYLNYLINVIVGYLLLKNCKVLVSSHHENNEVDAILCLDYMWISLRDCFYTPYSDVKQLEYYLQVFLHQEVASNQWWDIEMMKKLGDLYPRQLENPLSFLSMPKHFYNTMITDALLTGVDPINKIYIPNINQRIIAYNQWAETQVFTFSDKMQEKLFNLAVANLEKQPVAPYYVFFDMITSGNYFILTKEQYIRFLRDFISSNCFRKCDNDYVDLLNGDIMSYVTLDELYNMNFHVAFPQVFAEFDVNTWDFVQDFNVGTKLLMLILKTYVAKLIYKYYEYLQLNSLFFQAYLKEINCNYDEILKNVNNLSDELFTKIIYQLLEEDLSSFRVK